MYTNSQGIKVDVKTLETTHLLNALTKKKVDVYKSTSLEQYNAYIEEIQALEDEYTKRLNKFLADKLDKEW